MSLGSTSCSQDDGQCKCKRNVDGISCDRCKVGYYGLSTNNAAGCMACTCDSKGTVGNTGQCDQRSGVCTCKALVTGQSCSLCKVGTYGLAAAKSDGCTSCNCDPKGTVAGDTTPKGMCSHTSLIGESLIRHDHEMNIVETSITYLETSLKHP